MGKVEEAVKESLKPIVSAGKIISKAGKQKVIERLAPLSPGEAPSIKRKILEQILRETKR